MVHNVKSQILHCHPFPACVCVQEIRIIFLEINRDLVLILVHGKGGALNREILIQIITPALQITDNIIQGILFLITRAVLHTHNHLIHIQDAVRLKHAFVSHICEYTADITAQLAGKLG